MRVAGPRRQGAKIGNDTVGAHVASYSRRSSWVMYEIQSPAAHDDIAIP
jgi:hypothetical protein